MDYSKKKHAIKSCLLIFLLIEIFISTNLYSAEVAINSNSHHLYDTNQQFSTISINTKKLKITDESIPTTLIKKCTNGDNIITNYYVALTGNDALNDGSKNCPFKTIKYGVSFLKPGDKLILLPGNYQEKNIQIVNSGTAEHPITIMAETIGSVFLSGGRPAGAIHSNLNYGDGFYLHNVSNIIIDGINFSNFVAGIKLYGKSSGISKNITIKNSTFTNNSDVGIQNWKSDYLRVLNCRFLSSIPANGWPNPNEPNAIQDYGVSIYHSTGTIVEESYFYGAHNQALSFKYGCHNGIARRNIFAGNLYTAIYLGQGSKTSRRPTSTNLLVEYNIIRPAKEHRLKNPITIMNVKNATIRYNYTDSYGLPHNKTGISIFKEARGLIKIHDNIVAFSLKGTPLNPIASIGVNLQSNLPEKTQVKIYNNIFYDLHYDFQETFSNSHSFENNITWKSKHYFFTPPTQKPNFINGIPISPAVDSQPTYHNFDSYYKTLTDPFKLSKDGSNSHHTKQLNLQVSANNNDVVEDSDGNFKLSGPTQFGHYYWTNNTISVDRNYSSFYRWVTSEIKNGDTVKSAILTLYMKQNAYNHAHNISTQFLGITEDDTAVFSSENKPSSRPLTIATVIKNNWMTNDLSQSIWNNPHTPVTIDITSMIQEIINRPGFSEGNAIGIAHINNNSYHAYGAHYEFSENPSYAPKLEIIYTQNN